MNLNIIDQLKPGTELRGDICVVYRIWGNNSDRGPEHIVGYAETETQANLLAVNAGWYGSNGRVEAVKALCCKMYDNKSEDRYFLIEKIELLDRKQELQKKALEKLAKQLTPEEINILGLSDSVSRLKQDLQLDFDSKYDSKDDYK